MSGVGMQDGNVTAAGVSAKRARIGTMEFTADAITGVASIDGAPYPPVVSVGPFALDSIVTGTDATLPAPVLQDSGAFLKTYLDGGMNVEARAVCFDGDNANACVGFNVLPRLMVMTCATAAGPFPPEDYSRVIATELGTLQVASAANAIVAQNSVSTTEISSTFKTPDGLFTVADSVITATSNIHSVNNAVGAMRTRVSLDALDVDITSAAGNINLTSAFSVDVTGDGINLTGDGSACQMSNVNNNKVVVAPATVSLQTQGGMQLNFAAANTGTYTWPAALPSADSVLKSSIAGVLSWDPTPYELADSNEFYCMDMAGVKMTMGDVKLLVQPITATLYRLTGYLSTTAIGAATATWDLKIKYPSSLPAVAANPTFVSAPLMVSGTSAAVVLPAGLLGWMVRPSQTHAKSFDVLTVRRTSGTALDTLVAAVNTLPTATPTVLGFDCLLYTV